MVLFTRDLRVHDHPALAQAARDGSAVPLFVDDPTISANGFATPNRTAFLAESLADLRGALRQRGGDLVVRAGDPAVEAVGVARTVGADTIRLSADVSAFARRRYERLVAAAEPHGIEVVLHSGVTVVRPGRVTTTTGGRFQVFTPFSRAWAGTRWRDVVDAPRRVVVPAGVDPGDLPAVDRAGCSPDLAAGGEDAARAALTRWLRSGLADYAATRDVFAAEAGTSRLSSYLHFGCLSPLEVAVRAGGRPGGDDFVRQLAWRDFHHDTLDRFGELPHRELRPRGRRWRHDADVVAAWEEGRTGYPIVDAAMRQLAAEGWMHNRARMLTASFLTKTLGQDWRLGAAHFLRWLVDGDIANNSANWQWVAGTGCDTRPNRVLNPIRQAERFDPDGAYTLRYVPELAGLAPAAVRRPWTLTGDARRELDYPEPIHPPGD